MNLDGTIEETFPVRNAENALLKNITILLLTEKNTGNEKINETNSSLLSKISV